MSCSSNTTLLWCECLLPLQISRSPSSTLTLCSLTRWEFLH
ncbi:hypothetical protein T11_14103 [Trichinella zimbabwensis]|uniref:Uncharacterized protein n=1 Tax=Trichinella zimbabwensis TaxID=268475 RepID=A0A0V1E3X4_9BILA|nr:hypothetical protein T11_14103 [Trichinella zimbabwensis]